MAYEWLLRRVYNSGRNFASGAEADIYRKMEREHHGLTITHMNGTQESREYEYRKAFTAVRGYVSKALAEGIKQIGYRAEDDEKAQLQKMAGRLMMDFYDKAALDEIIRAADAIFHKYGLQGR